MRFRNGVACFSEAGETPPSLEINGLKFSVTSNTPGVDLKKSLLSNEWHYECPKCKQKIDVSMADVGTGLIGKLYAVQLFQNVALSSSKLPKQKDFLSYLITLHKIRKEYTEVAGISEVGKIQKTGANYKDIKCSNCGKSVRIDFFAEATATLELPYIPWYKGDVKSLTDEQKQQIAATIEVRTDDEIDKILALGEAGWMVALIQKLPLGNWNGLEFKIRWTDYGPTRPEDEGLVSVTSKSAEENAKKFADNLTILLKDIKNSRTITTEILDAVEKQAVQFGSEQAKNYIYELVNTMRIGLPEIEKKLIRMVLERLFWLDAEIGHLVDGGKI